METRADQCSGGGALGMRKLGLGASDFPYVLKLLIPKQRSSSKMHPENTNWPHRSPVAGGCLR